MTSPLTSSAGALPALSQVDQWLVRSARNYAAFWDHPVRAMGRRWVHWHDVWAADSQCPNPVPNQVTLLRAVALPQMGSLVAQLSRFYAERPGAPWILVNPWPSPDLQQWGFQSLGPLPLMVRLPTGTLPPALSELRIAEVTDDAAMADFERVLIGGFPLPECSPSASARSTTSACWGARSVSGWGT
jgi:hypothetical protein